MRPLLLLPLLALTASAGTKTTWSLRDLNEWGDDAKEELKKHLNLAGMPQADQADLMTEVGKQGGLMKATMTPEDSKKMAKTQGGLAKEGMEQVHPTKEAMTQGGAAKEAAKSREGRRRQGYTPAGDEPKKCNALTLEDCDARGRAYLQRSRAKFGSDADEYREEYERLVEVSQRDAMAGDAWIKEQVFLFGQLTMMAQDRMGGEF